MNILHKIKNFFTLEDEFKEIEDRKQTFIDSLDERQHDLYNKYAADNTPLREILCSLEQRIYDLESNKKKCRKIKDL